MQAAPWTACTLAPLCEKEGGSSGMHGGWGCSSSSFLAESLSLSVNYLQAAPPPQGVMPAGAPRGQVADSCCLRLVFIGVLLSPRADPPL